MRKALSREELLDVYDEQKEKMSPEEREQTLNKKLEKQLRFAYKNSPAVREMFDSAGIAPSGIKTVRDLERLPVTTKDDLVELQRARPPFGGFLAVPLSSLDRIYVSPGPIYDVWGPERIYAQLRSFLRLGFPKFGDVVLVSTAYHMVPAGLCMTDALDLMGCTVVPAGTGQTELQVKLLHELQPTALFGFPSFVMTVLEKAEELGYDVRRDFNLKFVPGGGERHIQILKKVFEEKYGLVVGDAYGTADVGPVAYCCGRSDGYHYDDEACVIEIVDPDTGKQVGPEELGQVVITLFSGVYPLVRFGTGDLAAYTDEPCRCGRSAPRITGIKGMVGQHVRVKGMFVHQKELAEAMSAFPQILKYQMLLTLDGHKDHIVLKVEVPSGADREALASAVNKRCQDVFKLRMDEIEFLSEGALSANTERFADQRWG
jgi:phenylacetate-CoA ligase